MPNNMTLDEFKLRYYDLMDSISHMFIAHYSCVKIAQKEDLDDIKKKEKDLYALYFKIEDLDEQSAVSDLVNEFGDAVRLNADKIYKYVKHHGFFEDLSILDSVGVSNEERRINKTF